MNTGLLGPGVTFASINRDLKNIRWAYDLVKPAR
jgi:hypothetical protein